VDRTSRPWRGLPSPLLAGTIEPIACKPEVSDVTCMLPQDDREAIDEGIKITATADGPGPEGMRLPRRRVEALRNYFIGLGVPAWRIYATVTPGAVTRIRAVEGPRLASGPVSMIAFPQVVRAVHAELTHGCSG
jgi:hypothetical protein